MSSSEASAMALARRGALPPDAGGSLSGLVAVLDRADAGRRSRPVHTAAFRATVRPVPLRTMQLAPSARPARLPVVPAPRTPTVTVVPDRVRRPVAGLRDLTRRIALWGGGANGEHLAWRTPEPAPSVSLRRRLHALTRRAAHWGAGPHGEHLAWGRPAPVEVPAPTRVDAPVVLRELPSTPTIRPAAPSPAVALLPAPVGPVRPGWAPPPPGWPQPPAWRTPAPARSAAVARPVPVARTATPGAGRTVPAARSPAGGARAGPARARGDPSSRAEPRRTPPATG
ncbi:hypothetical protein JKP75_18815 [Blastococcus sp. TML/M2B]|uniref:hypothetical protein n=1 Tax=unclassified Blastococcus TaxID=2619396 RepID=UPI00190D1E52|nr:MULTISPECIES: hypothetical protein [unclassified Blastococcus]MBN1094416.1 hypothetical protein [Blastococcus sp. TML/M2B]MBN1095375.1 hypothetical protein [Blastococcus sp. TML/C7B]